MRRTALVLGAVTIVGAIVALVDSGLPSAASLVPPAAAWLFASAALAIGSRINRGPIEEDFAVGCVMLSLWPILLHKLGHLRELELALPVFIAALFGPGRAAWSWLRDAPARLVSTASSGGVFGASMILLGGFGLAWTMLSTFAPPAGMDALTYHIGLPVQYIARGSLTPPDAVHYYQYTQGGEMITLIGVALDRTGIAANIILGLAFPAAVLAASRTSGEIAFESSGDAGRRDEARMIAFGVVATSAIAIFTVAHTKTDVLTLLLFLLALRRLLPGTFSPIRAAFLLGASLAVKITAVYGVLPALVVLAWKTRRRPMLWPLLAALLVAMPGYWWIRNILQFGTIMPQTGHVLASTAGSIAAPLAERALRIFASFFLFIDQGIDGPYGAASAAVTLASILSLRASHRPLLDDSFGVTALVTIVAIALWFVTGGGSHAYARGGLFRFVLPALGSALAGGSAYIAVAIMPGLATALRRLLKIGLVIAAAASLLVAVRIQMKYQPFPSYLCGAITMEQYMTNWSSSWRIQDEASRILPANAKVLSIGESRLFYLHRNASFEFDADLPRIFGVMHDASCTDDTATIAHLGEWIHREGYTHILYAPDWYATKILVGLAPSPPRYGDGSVLERFLAEHTSRILEDTTRHVAIYEVRKAAE